MPCGHHEHRFCQQIVLLSAKLLTPQSVTDNTRDGYDYQSAVALLTAALGPAVELQPVDALATPEADVAAPDGLLMQAKWHPSTAGASRGTRSARFYLVAYDPGLDASPDHPDRPNTVWVLRRGTPALRETLRQRGASFVDLAGAAHLRLPWLVVDRNDLPQRRPNAAGRAPVDPFGDHNSRVVRTLLGAHRQDSAPRAWGVRALAAASGVDRTTTSRVLRRLAAWDLVRLEPRGRAVAATLGDLGRVLDRWSTRYDWTANAALAAHAPIGDPRRFLTQLPAALRDRRWALTLHAGAALLAPHATWDRVHVYVDVGDAAELREVVAAAGWTPAADGNIVLLRPYYRLTAWDSCERIGDVWRVGLTQLLIDLWGYPLRGREQAEHLLEMRDRPARPPALSTDSPRTDTRHA